WQRLVPGETWANITGATSTTYTFTTSAEKNLYRYRAIFTNSYGSATSNVATLNVKVSDWSAQPSFLSRPGSGVIEIVGQSGFTISNKSFVNQVGDGVVSIQIENCSNFKIIGLDFSGDTEPIFCLNCTDFEIGWCRALNIVGPSTQNDTHRGNFYQFESCLTYHIH